MGKKWGNRKTIQFNKNLALCVLDICPTLDMYETTDRKFAKSYFHWFFLIQPSWLPERMIMSDPRKWMKSNTLG